VLGVGGGGSRKTLDPPRIQATKQVPATVERAVAMGSGRERSRKEKWVNRGVEASLSRATGP